MKKMLTMTALAAALALPAWAQGERSVTFGLQAGAYTPYQGFEDSDLAFGLGLNLWLRTSLLGLKFSVDSMNYENEVTLGPLTGEADMDIVPSLDLTVNLMGDRLYFLAGVNWADISGKIEDAVFSDNKVGLDLGLGGFLTDSLVLQGKILYTPDAFESVTVDIVEGLDDTNAQGIQLTLGWQF
ncbi:MAG: outer membrane beta-barrel protein [Acidobacteriota bacterium]|nr:outer membrane beta-barrel protein [Acidobacteriota bacterium]